MNHTIQRVAPLEWLLAHTLYYGTLMASAVVCLGLGLAMIGARFGAPRLAILRDMRIATIGIALFILLPVARVMVMLVAYIRQRDYRLSAISLLVLTVILLGFAVGLAGRRGKAPAASMQVRGKAGGRSLHVHTKLVSSHVLELRRIKYEHDFDRRKGTQIISAEHCF
jgi:hypothetical protein